MFKQYGKFSDLINQQKNTMYTTTSTLNLNEEIIWLDAVNSALIRCSATSAMDEADKILEGFKKRFSNKNKDN